MKKLLSCFAAAVLFLNTTAFAGVLGEVSGGYTNDMGLGTFFHKTEFSGSSRGNQVEHFIEYTPNTDITPVVISGEQLWGTIDIYDAQNVITADGLRSTGAINADFFSFKTGLSMGYTISEGEIVTKVYEKMPAIGFRKDGTAFIDDLQIKTTISKGDKSAEILFINKWCQPGFDPIYLLTDYFGETTKTNSNCLYIIGKISEGSISLKNDAIFEVEEVFEYDGEIKIPDGKAVLLIDVAGGNTEFMDFMRSVEVGDKLTITNECLASQKNLWNEAEEACSTITPYLLRNGEIGSGYEAGVHPRTAAGITSEGKIILYTLDGRKSGYSAGATLEEIANRMKELGCIDAINFDGGGSTAIGAKLSDLPAFQVLNRPSDGSVRNVANYIFLRDNRLPTGVPKTIKYKNLVKNVYINSNQNIEIESVYDTADYEMTDYAMKISSNDAKVDGNNVKFVKSGIASVKIGINNHADELQFNVYDTIDSFKVFETKSWKEVESINLSAGEEYEVQLRVVPYADENELLLNEGVKWEIEGDIGSISDTGYLKIGSDRENGGVIKISLANISKEIPVIIKNSIFYDTQGHWADEMINALAKERILSGIRTDKGLAFFPDNNMTRVEFAAVISRYLGLDVESYVEDRLNFADAHDIDSWAHNIVKAVSAAGIMKGASNDGGKTFLFEPKSNITRAEAMTVIGRTISQSNYNNTQFSDDELIPDWAREEVSKLTALGIVQGYSDNTIKPTKSVTRSEATSLIYKLMNKR